MQRKSYIVKQYTKKSQNQQQCKSFDFSICKQPKSRNSQIMNNQTLNTKNSSYQNDMNYDLQQQVKQLSEKATQDKAKIIKIENENKYFKNFLTNNDQLESQKNLSIINTLKKACKQKDQDIQQITKQLNETKRLIKTTQIQELQCHNNQLQIETQRLQFIIQNQNINNDISLFVQTKFENQQLSEEIQIIKKKNLKLQKENQHLKIELKKYQDILNKYNSVQQESLKTSVIFKKDEKIKQQLIEIQNSQKIIDKLNQDVQNMNIQYDILEKKSKKMISYPFLYKQLKFDYQKLREEYDEQKELCNHLQQLLNKNNTDVKIDIGFISKEKIQISRTIKNKKVKIDDIQKICTHLRFKLITQNIQFETIDKYFKIYDQKQITQEQIIEILKNKPFELQNNEILEIFSRYLIQNEQLKDTNQQEISMVIIIFKNAIKKYQFLDKKELEYHLKILSEYLIKNKDYIVQKCQEGSKKRGFSKLLAHIDDLLDSIYFSPLQKELINEHIFRTTNELNIFVFLQFWQYWIQINQKFSLVLNKFRDKIKDNILMNKFVKGVSPQKNKQQIDIDQIQQSEEKTKIINQFHENEYQDTGHQVNQEINQILNQIKKNDSFEEKIDLLII